MKNQIVKDRKKFILPGLIDVHVHLREPGFLYKETIATGTMAAAAGGFTDVCAMPNLDPCPDSEEGLQVELDAIKKDAIVNVWSYGAITIGEKGGELVDMEALFQKVIAFSDDGFGIESHEMMEAAMRKAKELGKIIVAHCEDKGYPKESSQSEWKQLHRDIELVRKTGCSYHACHISTKESVEIIRKAKREGLDVSCETAPHYLLLTGEDAKNAGETPGRFKMNPPLKTEEDRQALLEALEDGIIDMLATDHAPHAKEEKRGEFEECAYGITGLETAFPVLYTNLVCKGAITMQRLLHLMNGAPAQRFNIKRNEDSYSVWDLTEEYRIDPGKFKSKGKSTPFEGWKVCGRCLKTVINGKEIYTYDDK